MFWALDEAVVRDGSTLVGARERPICVPSTAGKPAVGSCTGTGMAD